jgi:hypothetical protein
MPMRRVRGVAGAGAVVVVGGAVVGGAVVGAVVAVTVVGATVYSVTTVVGAAVAGGSVVVGSVCADAATGASRAPQSARASPTSIGRPAGRRNLLRSMAGTRMTLSGRSTSPHA